MSLNSGALTKNETRDFQEISMLWEAFFAMDFRGWCWICARVSSLPRTVMTRESLLFVDNFWVGQDQRQWLHWHQDLRTLLKSSVGVWPTLTAQEAAYGQPTRSEVYSDSDTSKGKCTVWEPSPTRSSSGWLHLTVWISTQCRLHW